MLKIRAVAPLAMLLLSGCVVGPDHEAPQTTLPVKFSEGSAKAAAQDVTLAPWWTAFRDPRLTSLVEKGLAQNLDVLQALERITAAEANFDAADSGAFPQVNLSTDHQVSRTNGTGALTSRDSDTTNTSTGSVGVSWLLDLFGQYRRSKESAKASLDAAFASADVAKLTFLSSVVSAYVDARYYQERIAIARKNLGSRRETLELTRLQLEAGAASRLDVVQSEGLVNSTLAEIPGLEISFRQSVHRISLLLGLPATSLLADLQKGASQPYARGSVNAGVPADLIRNRPDIRAAERNLAAAVAEIGVAEAALYPSISLSGSISPTLVATSAASGHATSWGFGPSLNLPIFDAGTRRANVKAREAAAREAYLAWKQTVLGAVSEVENAMVAVNRTRQTVSALTATVRSYEEALSLATASYRDGASSLLDVLDAQRNVASAQANLAQAVQQLANGYVSLNVAIGGGYAWDKKTVVASQ
ncbi:multidrug efflux system outer membrane protein [Peteryoungia aggregata LMG 23059]|uniref:Multidrug efflux system outer membrane protein n=1 Tax=Peteryoungia aggregata LMG 23059 TaxID=1368425 RepID=A0ABU0GFJ5_9HYPH|nr:efflux transporter outer membrane subunit [Peteryoungia aggregata]MDQ0423400.1 multidrug efflux system outer membrane protein [Peteryoungia aggregata LMG 23059]